MDKFQVDSSELDKNAERMYEFTKKLADNLKNFAKDYHIELKSNNDFSLYMWVRSAYEHALEPFCVITKD